MSRLSVALLSIALVGCFSEPGRPAGSVHDGDVGDDDGGSGSGTPDAYEGPLKAKLLSSSFWAMTTGGDPDGMSKQTWELDLSGAQDGQLLIVLATVDNGSNHLFNSSEFSPGWTYISNIYTDHPEDTQTTIFAWKIADHESTLSGTYTDTFTSGGAAFVVLAIDGFDQMSPIETRDTGQGALPYTSAVTIKSGGVDVSVPGTLLLYAMATDWDTGNSTFTHAIPAGYDELANVTDRGRGHDDYQWSTLVVSEKPNVATGPTGNVMGTTTAASDTGVGVYGLIAIRPK